MINCTNGIMKLSLGNMTIYLNIFSLQRQPAIVDENDNANWLNVYACDGSCADGLFENDTLEEIDSPSHDCFNSLLL